MKNCFASFCHAVYKITFGKYVCIHVSVLGLPEPVKLTMDEETKEKNLKEDRRYKSNFHGNNRGKFRIKRGKGKEGR